MATPPSPLGSIPTDGNQLPINDDGTPTVSRLHLDVRHHRGSAGSLTDLDDHPHPNGVLGRSRGAQSDPLTRAQADLSPRNPNGSDKARSAATKPNQRELVSFQIRGRKQRRLIVGISVDGELRRRILLHRDNQMKGDEHCHRRSEHDDAYTTILTVLGLDAHRDRGEAHRPLLQERLRFTLCS
jgi:hypothetical protein